MNSSVIAGGLQAAQNTQIKTFQYSSFFDNVVKILGR